MASESPSGARLALAGAAALFSTGGAAIKATSLTGLQVAGLRSLVACVLLGLAFPAARRGLDRKSLVVSLGYAATMVLFVAANKLTTSANTIFLQSTAPLWVVLLGPWLLREPIVRRDAPFMLTLAVGLACFFAGTESPRASAPNPLLGNALATVAGLTWACTIVGLRWLGRDVSDRGRARSAAALVLGNLVASAVTLPWAGPWGAFAARDALTLAYLGVFQIGAAYLLLARGLRGVGALEASLLLLIEPVLNPIWAFLLQGEVPGAWALAGAGLVLTATAARAFQRAA